MNWDKFTAEITAAVKVVGADSVLDLVKRAAAAEESRIVERESRVKLPDGYRFFVKEDWYGLAGAERFPDGVRPVIGSLGVNQAGELPWLDCTVVVSHVEQGNGEALAGIQWSGNDDESHEIYKKFPSLTAALAFFALVGKEAHIDQLHSFGFSD